MSRPAGRHSDPMDGHVDGLVSRYVDGHVGARNSDQARDQISASGAEPTPAERVLSALTTATSITVTTDAHRCELSGLHRLAEAGGLLVCVPVASRLSAEVAHAPVGGVAAVVELTDIAPVAVADRVRTRVTMHGWLAIRDYDDGGEDIELWFDPAHVELERDGSTLVLEPDELGGAKPDPLAGYESDLLMHLDAQHRDVVALLTRLVEPRLLQSVARVCPVALDRYGVVLRLEYAGTGGRRDVRIPFAVPVHEVAEVESRVRGLLAAARWCARRRRDTP